MQAPRPCHPWDRLGFLRLCPASRPSFLAAVCLAFSKPGHGAVSSDGRVHPGSHHRGRDAELCLRAAGSWAPAPRSLCSASTKCHPHRCRLALPSFPYAESQSTDVLSAALSRHVRGASCGQTHRERVGFHCTAMFPWTENPRSLTWPPAAGHLGCFRFGATMDKTVMNTDSHFSG